MQHFVVAQEEAGWTVQAERVAEQTALARGLDLHCYERVKLQQGRNLVVIFRPPNQPKGMRGSAGGPTFEVEVDPSLKVVRAQFAR
jgi:hypothetical protein